MLTMSCRKNLVAITKSAYTVEKSNAIEVSLNAQDVYCSGGEGWVSGA
jgi:hypothetical protein